MAKPFYFLAKPLLIGQTNIHFRLNFAFHQNLFTCWLNHCISTKHLPLSLDKTNIYFWLNYTYSPIYLKIVIFIPTYLFAHPFVYLFICPCTFLPISLLSRYVPDPTYMVGSTYFVSTPIDLAIAKNDEEKNKMKDIAWSLDLFIQAKI